MIELDQNSCNYNLSTIRYLLCFYYNKYFHSKLHQTQTGNGKSPELVRAPKLLKLRVGIFPEVVTKGLVYTSLSRLKAGRRRTGHDVTGTSHMPGTILRVARLVSCGCEVSH